MLLLRHAQSSAADRQLPQLRALEVKAWPGDPYGAALAFCLTDPALKDLFLRFCYDIIERVADAATEAEAVAVAVGRAWRWHYLLRGGANGMLSERAQLGLIGELLVLERYFLPALAPDVAVGAWHGPVGAAQDFSYGTIAVEAKCKPASDAGKVTISSEHQLNIGGLSALFLHVVTCVRPESETDTSFSLTELAERIRARLLASDAVAAARFEGLLTAAGFDFAHDYSNSKWTERAQAIYKVGEGFPSIVANAVPSGVSEVSYSIGLASAAEYVVIPTDLIAALGGT